ncbi:MAG: cyclopropane-fatty-acyl-phospholipid synthase family protein [Pseudomonadota bacterium]|nr:cyclopropane-fatty-acyl-phospholipid synthase family protein [Pseudomonadota bacterium]
MTTKSTPPLAFDDARGGSEAYGESARRAGESILSILLQGYAGPVAVRLWDGTEINRTPDTACTLVFHDPAPLRELVLRHDMVRLGEAYLAGHVDADGDIEAVFHLAEYLQQHPLPWSRRLRLLRHALRLPARVNYALARERRAGRQASRNSRASISHHYDVSNDFYRLWLDPELVYSCAYFRDAAQSLADAQRDKLEYICRKLRLGPGQRLLDIGCGWGALLLWAARHHGVEAHGITLSGQQHALARERIRAAGLAGRVTVELRDYRDLERTARYDRVVSVGMFEHIGIGNFPLYFGIVKQVLKPGGLFLNHGITNDTGWLRDSMTARFINRYVFPDGELTRISEVITAMENAGYEILDVESLRRHYTLTLRHWYQNLERHAQAALAEVGEATYRLWRLYMAGSAFYFATGGNNVYQVLASHHRQPLTLPLRRDDIYRGDLAAGTKN